jgi:hypothetical protein
LSRCSLNTWRLPETACLLLIISPVDGKYQGKIFPRKFKFVQWQSRYLP